MKKTIATLALVATAFSTPAFAWGEREQGILTGIVATIIYQDIQRGQQQGGVVVQQQPQVIHQPQRQVIYSGQNCGIEIRTVWTDNYRREIRSEHDRCTGALLRRTEIIHQR